MGIKMMYWLSTGVISAFLFLSAFTYLFSKSTIEGIEELGFPDFFRVELVILKFIAGFVILLPFVPMVIKEWAYAGVGLFLLTALVAHVRHKDGFFIMILLFVLMAILVVSNVYLKKG